MPDQVKAASMQLAKTTGRAVFVFLHRGRFLLDQLGSQELPEGSRLYATVTRDGHIYPRGA